MGLLGGHSGSKLVNLQTYLRIGSLHCSKSSEHGQDVTKTKIVMHLT